MTGLSRRGLYWVALGGCAVAAIGVLVGTSAGRLTGSATGATPATVRVLQLNLCNSGIAPCYTGRSVARAAALIRAEHPDVVTLNEVCRSDVAALDRTLAREGAVVSAFRAAVVRGTGLPVHCRNGQQYGIGLLARVGAPYQGYATYGSVYPVQDPGDVEERVWLCVHPPDRPYMCTTHLSDSSPLVAFAQCRYVLHTAVPALRARHGNDPILLGGDLNLEDGRTPDPRSCLPAGYAHADDGSRQHVVAGKGFVVRSSRTMSMQHTTDHPALLVDLATAG